MFLALKESVDVVSVEGGVILTENDLCELIEGDTAAQIIQSVAQGQVSREMLIARHSGLYSEIEVSELINSLIEDDLLVEFDTQIANETLQKWYQLNISPAKVQDALDQCPVQVIDLSRTAGKLQAYIKDWGFNTSERGYKVVVADYIGTEQIGEINRVACMNSEAWMLVDLERLQMIAFQPGKTACWECLMSAMYQNNPFGEENTYRRNPSALHVEVFLEAVAHKLLFQFMQNEASYGVLLRQQAINQPMQMHAVLSRFNCLVCGTDSKPNNEFVKHVSHALEMPFSAGYKQNSESDFEKNSYLISPVTGLFRSLWELPVIDEAMGYITVMNHSMVRARPETEAFKSGLQGRSIGKGKTLEAARTSVLYEGIERYSGIWRTEIPLRWESYDRFTGDALPVHVLRGYSEKQLLERENWNKHNNFDLLHIPKPFNPKKEMGWVEGVNITQKAIAWVPAEYCFYDYPESDGFLCDSNGCAAGQSYDSAIKSGLFELIERDAIAIWWYQKNIQRPALAFHQFTDEYIRAQPEAYHNCNRLLWLLDLTTDLEIPVVAAVSRHIENEEDWLLGFGCAETYTKAAQSALLELNQVISTRAQTSTPAPLFTDLLGNNPLWMKPDVLQVSQPLTDIDNTIGQGISISSLVQILGEKGLEVTVVNQTDPDIGVPVVRVIVPGLCHHWRRLGVERLYRMPVDMTWQNKSVNEQELNAIHMLL